MALVYGILVDMANWYIRRLKESACLVWWLTISLSLRSLCFGGMKDLNYNQRHNCQQYYVFEEHSMLQEVPTGLLFKY